MAIGHSIGCDIAHPSPGLTRQRSVVRPIKYVAADGQIVCCGRLRRHAVPIKIADEALRTSAAWPETDPRVKGNEGLAGMVVPDEAACEWIGPQRKTEPKFMRPAKPVMHSTFTAFTPYDRGGPITGTMKTTPIEATATRSAPEDEQ
jgi:hypothetical protein